MTTTLVGSQRVWEGESSECAQRTFYVEWLVKADRNDGPYSVLNCPGLPLTGAPWAFGNDFDPWAWCRPDVKVRRHPEAKEGDPTQWWLVRQRFSTEPLQHDCQRCFNTPILDPLLEPPKISGSGIKYLKEAAFDKFGKLIANSSFEQIRGPEVEFDKSRHKLRIEFNVATFDDVALAISMADSVNAFPIWGMAERTVKMDYPNWDRKYYGLCSTYYTLHLEFEMRPDPYDGFDRILMDEGSKVLHGHWDVDTGTWVLDDINGQAPDPNNPTHFIRLQDPRGNPIRAPLNGAGVPAGVPVTVNITGIALSLTLNQNMLLCTVTTNTPHGFSVGSASAIINANPKEWNIPFVVYTVPSSTQFTFLMPVGRCVMLGPAAKAVSPINTQYVGSGKVNTPGNGPGIIVVQKYWQADYTLLGVPLVF